MERSPPGKYFLTEILCGVKEAFNTSRSASGWNRRGKGINRIDELGAADRYQPEPFAKIDLLEDSARNPEGVDE